MTDITEECREAFEKMADAQAMSADAKSLRTDTGYSCPMLHARFQGFVMAWQAREEEVQALREAKAEPACKIEFENGLYKMVNADGSPFQITNYKNVTLYAAPPTTAEVKAQALEDADILAFMERTKPTITNGPEGWSTTVRHMNSFGSGETFREAILQTMAAEENRAEAKRIREEAK